MLELISCYHHNEESVINRVIQEAVAHTKRIFSEHYSTTIVLNKHHYLFTTLDFDYQRTGTVWELTVKKDEPILVTFFPLSPSKFCDTISYIVNELRKLSFCKTV